MGQRQGVGDMQKKRFVSTGEIAKICQVSSKTVISWIEKKQLRSFRIGTGPRRVALRDLHAFLNAKKFPVATEDDLLKMIDSNNLKKHSLTV